MRNILVVVDMQNDFRPSDDVVKRVVSKIEKYIANGSYIYLTMDSHNDKVYNKMLESRLYEKHCVYGTSGFELIPEVGKAIALHGVKSTVIYKSGFGSYELANRILRDCTADDTIEICGVATEVCVVSNALMIRSVLYNHEIIVDHRAVGAIDEERGNAALDVMRSCNITVI